MVLKLFHEIILSLICVNIHDKNYKVFKKNLFLPKSRRLQRDVFIIIIC